MATHQSLAYTHPEIAQEWDFEKNGELTPDNVSKGQTIKVYWRCRNGHSYQSRIDHRCSMHSGCPYCAGKLPLKGVNDLETTYPEIAQEWDFSKNESTPQEYLPFSNKKVYWICPICQGSYSQKIVNRTYNAYGCKYCMGERHTSRQEQTIFYYLSQVTTVENRAKVAGCEIDVFLPQLNIGIEYNGEYYHENRADSDKSKAQRLIANGIKLITVSCGRERALTENHIVLKTVKNTNPSDNEFYWGLTELFTMLQLPKPIISFRNDMVNIYALYIKSIKDNSISQKYPNIAKEWDYDRNKGLKPESFSYGSDKTVWWKCPNCKQSYDTKISNRIFGNQGCPYCAGKRISVGHNDLATTNPELVLDWDIDANAKTPQHVTKGSSYMAYWKCSICGYEWKAIVSSRTRGNGCPACAGRVAMPGYNDLLTQNPELNILWNYSKNTNKPPVQYTSGSQEKVWWRCNICGHEWQAVIASVVSGRRCPECAKKNRTITRHSTYLLKSGSLSEKYPDLIQDWNWERNTGISPDQLTPGSSKKVWWKCHKCGYDWQAIVYSRNAGRGCPRCGRIDSEIGRIASYIKKNGSLEEKHPHLLQEWDYVKNGALLPSQVTSGSNKKAWWICQKCGHQWYAVINSRTKGSGCPICARKKDI